MLYFMNSSRSVVPSSTRRTSGAATAMTAARRSRFSRQPTIGRVAPAGTVGSGQVAFFVPAGVWKHFIMMHPSGCSR